MKSPELLAALVPVVDVLDSMKVGYYVGGSVASSAHGIARASIDVDLVADLETRHVRPLVERLQEAYYLDEGRIGDAVEKRRSFNLVHLATMLKVDVFVLRGRPFDRQALERAHPEALDPGEPRRFMVASPEDIVLAKLEWFRMGDEVSSRQWADVIGVLKMAGPAADESYLRHWASSLGVLDLLERALNEAVD